MACCAYLILSVTAISACGNAISWEDEPAHLIDIDCDGVEDSVYLGRTAQEFLVKIRPSSTQRDFQLRFGIEQPRQDAICGATPVLTTEEATGKVLAVGEQAGLQCSHLRIDGGDCDAIRVFYDHSKRSLDWWRR